MQWRKSSRSGNEGNCVEVERTLRAVRDSKNPGVVLSVDVNALVGALRGGQINR